MEFKLLRTGIIDGVPTTQDITDHEQLREWSNFQNWKPETPYCKVMYGLKVVHETVDSYGIEERETCYYLVDIVISNDEVKFFDVNSKKRLNISLNQAGCTIYWRYFKG